MAKKKATKKAAKTLTLTQEEIQWVKKSAAHAKLIADLRESSVRA